MHINSHKTHICIWHFRLDQYYLHSFILSVVENALVFHCFFFLVLSLPHSLIHRCVFLSNVGIFRGSMEHSSTQPKKKPQAHYAFHNMNIIYKEKYTEINVRFGWCSNKTFFVKSKIEDNINMIYVCILSFNTKNHFTFLFVTFTLCVCMEIRLQATSANKNLLNIRMVYTICHYFSTVILCITYINDFIFVLLSVSVNGTYSWN